MIKNICIYIYMKNTLSYSEYKSDDKNKKSCLQINDYNKISIDEIEEFKYFLFLTTHNHYSNDEVEYIIKNRLLEYD